MDTATVYSLRCIRCRLSWDVSDRTAEKHEHLVKLNIVHGTLGGKECTSSCVNALGSECECSCGGKDHGRYA